MGLFLRLAFFCAFIVPWLASAASALQTGGVSLDVQKQSPDITYSLGPKLQSGGTHPKGIVVADFDGDGKPDIAVSNFDQNSVAVFLNRGLGIFCASNDGSNHYHGKSRQLFRAECRSSGCGRFQRRR